MGLGGFQVSSMRSTQSLFCMSLQHTHKKYLSHQTQWDTIPKESWLNRTYRAREDYLYPLWSMVVVVCVVVPESVVSWESFLFASKKLCIRRRMPPVQEVLTSGVRLARVMRSMIYEALANRGVRPLIKYGDRINISFYKMYNLM